MKFRIFLLSLWLVTQSFGSNVKITTTTLPNGTVGTAYSAAVQASGGCTPYSWAITSGAPPTGVKTSVSKSTTSVSLSGTPSQAATYSFTEKVTGCGGNSSQVSYKVIIQATANHVVDLNWKPSASTGVAGYNLYRAPDGVTWKKINPSLIGSTLYTDSTVANGSTYYYSATAVDVNGNESVKTPAVKAVVP